MSVDTITRVNAYFETNVADVIPVFTIYKNVNENLPEPGSGSFVKLWVEPSLDQLFTDGGKYQESGVIIAQIYVEEGESTLELHSISDVIKIAFRQLQLEPIGGEIGTITVSDIETANRGTVATEDYGSNISWRRWDVFITYAKYDCN